MCNYGKLKKIYFSLNIQIWISNPKQTLMNFCNYFHLRYLLDKNSKKKSWQNECSRALLECCGQNQYGQSLFGCNLLYSHYSENSYLSLEAFAIINENHIGGNCKILMVSSAVVSDTVFGFCK